MFAGGAWTEARPPRVSKIGPALSSSNTIRRRPSADPVQKHAPGNGYGAKKGLTSRGPLQKPAAARKEKHSTVFGQDRHLPSRSGVPAGTMDWVRPQCLQEGLGLKPGHPASLRLDRPFPL